MPSSLTSLLKLPEIFLIIAFFLSGLIFFAVILSDCIRRRLDPSPTSRGLDKRALNSLPKLNFSPASASAMEYKLEECAICLSQFEEGEEIRVLPRCGHGYHVVCIDTWLGSHSTCPSCRQIPLSVFDTCQKWVQSSGDRRLPEVAIEA